MGIFGFLMHVKFAPICVELGAFGSDNARNSWSSSIPMEILDNSALATESQGMPEHQCYHCGLPLDPKLPLQTEINGEARDMCCYGCKAVAEALVAAGHSHYYEVRTEPAITGQEILPDIVRETRVYDNEELQSQYVYNKDDYREINLILEGITCAACLWLNEQHLNSLSGVMEARVNYSSRRAWVRWDPKKIKLSEILLAIQSIGYHALPYDASLQQDIRVKERRRQLLKLGVAGLFGMQVMMIAIALYNGAWKGMNESFEHLFRWLSLGLCVPVIGYSAQPFYKAAWHDLKNRRAGMDVPVSIALLVAFTASVVNTINGQGEIYFDSVVMFVFLLSLSRFFESMASQRNAESVERLAHALPLMATRVREGLEEYDVISATRLEPGDRVLIKPGETVPADGHIIAGSSSADESLLSGESRPLSKQVGDELLGGSINIENPLQMIVSKVGSDTVLSGIQRMIEQAMHSKPGYSMLADRISAYFIFAVLGISSLVAIWWYFSGSANWLEITLATLIVSCPCALSLATPAAISAVLGKLQVDGLLVRGAGALEKLADVSCVVFDKTGTLTQARPELVDAWYDPEVGQDTALSIAASLETHSEHPLGKAILRAAGEGLRLTATDVKNHPGSGINGLVDGADCVIGNPDFVLSQLDAIDQPNINTVNHNDASASIVALARDRQLIAVFYFRDSLRSDAVALVRELKQDGKRVILMSGDQQAAAAELAQRVSIDEYHGEMSPDAKLDEVAKLQAAGETVLMVGDGINDAPVLAGADVSIAVADASSLAKTSADILLLSNRLDNVRIALEYSRKTRKIIRQNLTWALAYNISAIPAAAVGLVTPWIAAIGMSSSSLLVVMNAIRLRR